MTALATLQRAGAQLNAVDDAGWTPLFFAAQYGQLEAVRALLAAGAEPNVQVIPTVLRIYS